ncbi:MAG: hypothetical protein IT427_16440 [Pirellulales bacterium]|nr:hypothetical protein [Pirellulales bacterium]
MIRDSVFWIVIGLFGLTGVLLYLNERQFTTDNKFGNERFADEVLSHQTEVPEITRKFASYTSESKTGFSELRVGQLVRGSTKCIFGIAFVSFIVLSVRQHRLEKRLVRLEAEHSA